MGEATNTDVKLGIEGRVYLSSASSSNITITSATRLATESSPMYWQEIGFIRYPFTITMPINVVDVMKRFAIDHVKLGADGVNTARFQLAFNTTANTVQRFWTRPVLTGNFAVKVDWHPADQTTPDETEYLTKCLITNITRESGTDTAESTETVEMRFATYGRRGNPA